MRLIDADEIVKDLKAQMDLSNPNWSWNNHAMCQDLLEYLEKFPTIEPVKRGRWIRRTRHIGDIHKETGYVAFDGGVGVGEPITIKVDGRTEYTELYCSECGAVASDSFLYFCSRCGAKMDGEK